MKDWALYSVLVLILGLVLWPYLLVHALALRDTLQLARMMWITRKWSPQVGDIVLFRSMYGLVENRVEQVFESGKIQISDQLHPPWGGVRSFGAWPKSAMYFTGDWVGEDGKRKKR